MTKTGKTPMSPSAPSPAAWPRAPSARSRWISCCTARYRRGGGESRLPRVGVLVRPGQLGRRPAPAQVGKRLVEGLVTRRELPPRRARLVNNVTHWGYGMFGGAQYGIVVGSLRTPRIRYGLPFGAGVWAAGYVVLPAAGLYRPIWEYDLRDPRRRISSAHLVFGLDGHGAGCLSGRTVDDLTRPPLPLDGTPTADVMVATLKACGVRRIYGLPGDSLNGLTDALRRDGEIDWEHVRHEEAAAFAAAGEAAMTGRAGRVRRELRPGQPAPHQRAVRRQPQPGARARDRRAHPARGDRRGYFQETHPQELFRECSVYAELVSVPEQLPRVLRDRDAPRDRTRAAWPWSWSPARSSCTTRSPRTRPSRSGAATPKIAPPTTPALRDAAELLNAAGRVTILAGAGCEGAHDEVVAIAAALAAPVVHAMRGKEFVEYDNPNDVGMTGLLGFASGYRAMEHCDALLMLGTDFPYRPFFPAQRTRRAGRHPR